MLFNTLDFVIFFIVVLTTFVIIKNRKFQHLFLLLASYFFFYYSSNYLITLLIFTTIWDFYFGQLIYKADNVARKKLYLIVSLAGNLGLLGFFKYADFAITQFNFLGHYFDLGINIPLLNLALPIAISFYTFHSITYTVGIYRGQLEPARTFTEYAIFVAIFPQLVAGPILRAKEFLPQLRDRIENSHVGGRLRQIVIERSNLKYGITLMMFGFFKKMFFADNIAPLVNDVFSNPIGHDSLTIILTAIAFGIQIYCDFSGYSDIAIGAALIMGFKIPINFNKPYFAISPPDFWRRWHISLSTWLRDYLYIPLGGNRKSNSRTYLNLFVVMFLGGLWHGASWNFVIWGTLHGTYLALHRVMVNRFPNLTGINLEKNRMLKILTIIATQYLVFFAWIPFRIRDFDGMMYAMQKYVMIDVSVSSFIETIRSFEIPVMLIVAFFIIHYISYKKQNMVEIVSKLKMTRWFLFSTACALLIVLFYGGSPSEFIYFEF
ncbi:MBOAT family O-acyltransferase [Candidatus Nitrosotenuis cloacae]|uniref:MBOAT family O-acyltransferase n=1 Tax=Candidatus Nitrosotenuis cloacae TaxID=1603555 RepID=UPI00228204DA|nr:MBOAT family O-acyltransferase [Candidatus Nitrosotenuis cloacae]